MSETLVIVGRPALYLAFGSLGLYTRHLLFWCQAVHSRDSIRQVFHALVKPSSPERWNRARLEPSIIGWRIWNTDPRSASAVERNRSCEVAPRKGVTVARIDVEQLNNMFEALGEFEDFVRG
jgi:hypothetical protein